MTIIHIITIFAGNKVHNATMSYKSVKDVIMMLTENGFRFVRQKGSHMVYTDGEHIVVVPAHGKKGIEKGTYHNILRQAGLK